MTVSYTPPSEDEIEISIFGPGYGECIVIHAGFNDWLTVDSCIEPDSKKPVALAYLNALQIRVESQLHAVIATHWDDDHINGIAEVFRVAKKAKFVCSAAMQSKQFAAIIAAWRSKKFLPGGSGIDELDQVIDELHKRAKTTGYPMPFAASVQKIVWERDAPVAAELRALSPSDTAVAATNATFEEILKQSGKTTRRLPRITDNHASIVLSLKVAHLRALLGGDLQVRQNRSFGWLAIVDTLADSYLHEMYKIPHHGSENGDNDEIWQRLLHPNPITVTTPYVHANLRLPTPSDRQRIIRRSPASFLTAPPLPKKFRDPDHFVEKAVRNFSKQIHFVPGRFGHVRLRKRIADNDWSVALFGDACPMQDFRD